MQLTDHQLNYGYWPSRQLLGLNPAPIRWPHEYDGSATLQLSCTQTGLPPAQQRKLVADWVALLPSLPITTLLFASKVNQALFEAAAANPNLEALFVKWSSVGSIDALDGHPRLTALHLGDSPALSGLHHLSSLDCLRHVFIAGVRQPVDLDALHNRHQLVELGLYGGSQSLTLRSWELFGDMSSLRILWLARVRDSLSHLHHLQGLAQLQSWRTALNLQSPEVLALRQAMPGLRFMEPVR